MMIKTTRSHSLLLLVVVTLMSTTSTSAFTTVQPFSTSTPTRLFGVSLDDNNSDNKNNNMQSNLLQKTDLVANMKFDPLGLAKTELRLKYYREAEVKHARLAMVATAMILGTELYDRVLAEYWGLDLQLVEYNEESMLRLNLDRASPTLWGFLLGCMAAIELYGWDRFTSTSSSQQENGMDSYFAGNLGFDPAHWYPRDSKGQKRMQAGELHNGRLAMMGFVVYLCQVWDDEYVVPFLFRAWDL